MITTEFITKLQELDGNSSVVLVAEEGIYAVESVTNAGTSGIITIQRVADANEYAKKQGQGDIETNSHITEALEAVNTFL